VQAPSLPYAVIECAKFDKGRQLFDQQMASRSGSSCPVEPQHGSLRVQPIVDPDRVKFGPDHPFRTGVNIIKNVKRRQLTQQVRATDPAQVALVQKLFEGKQLSVQDFVPYSNLSQNDLNNEDWIDAPVLTATNRERYTFTHMLAKARACLRKTVVVRWRAQASSRWQRRPQTEEAREQALQDPAFFEYFVKDCHAYITANINKKLGIVNGAQVRYHSLSFHSDEEQELFEALVRDTPIGEVCTLPANLRPEAVNVELEGIENWPDGLTLVPGRVVIPIGTRPGRSKSSQWIPIPGGSTSNGHSYRPSRVKVSNFFPIDPGFAITFYKIQGRTLRNLIIALSQRSLAVCSLNYSDVYVAFSRVAQASDIRLLLTDTDGSKESIHFVSGLKPDPCTAAFLHGFDDDGNHWDLDRAWQHYTSLAGDPFAVPGRSNKRRKHMYMLA
jgi:hypothetical protein